MTNTESPAMRVLRPVTYVLVSLASVLFIAVTIYVAMQVAQLQTALSNFGAPPAVSAPAFPSPSPETFAPDPGFGEDIPEGDTGFEGDLSGDGPLTDEEYCANFSDDPMCEGIG